MRLQCKSCGGTYAPILPDGLQYFHRCPSLSAVELQAAVDAGTVKLPKGETADVAVRRRVYERATLRDENVTGPPLKAGDRAPIKAAGAGVVEIAGPDESAVVVVDV